MWSHEQESSKKLAHNPIQVLPQQSQRTCATRKELDVLHATGSMLKMLQSLWSGHMQLAISITTTLKANTQAEVSILTPSLPKMMKTEKLLVNGIDFFPLPHTNLDWL